MAVNAPGRKQKEIGAAPGYTAIPNFYWSSEGGHGFQGRHGYNPLTNEAISTRDAIDIINGRNTLDRVLAKQQTPLASYERHNATGVYRVSIFRTMSGAYAYATNGTDNPSYFVVKGRVRKPYQDKTERNYRAISTLMRPGKIRQVLSLEECWRRVSGLFTVGSDTRYIVWERINV